MRYVAFILVFGGPSVEGRVLARAAGDVGESAGESSD